MELLGLLVGAVLLAGLYATMSYGLALIYGVMKLVNLAHAGIMMMAAYVAFTLHDRFQLDPLAAVPITFGLFFVVGMGLYYVFVRGLPTASGPSIQSLLLLFGIWLVLQNVAYLVWGGSDRSILTPYTLTNFNLGGIRVAAIRLAVFAVGVASLVLLQLLLGRTYLGKAIRAVAQNRTAAQLVGVDAQRISMIAFGLGTAFAALAGNLMAVLYAFTPEFGRNFLLKAFAVIVLGGMESFTGVALGALILALFETFGVFVMENTMQDLIAFGLLVLVLVVLPGGITGLFERLGSGPRPAAASAGGVPPGTFPPRASRRRPGAGA